MGNTGLSCGICRVSECLFRDTADPGFAIGDSTMANHLAESGRVTMGVTVDEIVPLHASDYAALLARMVDWDLVSGAAYEDLHVNAAEKVGADKLLTCNGRDFRRMPPGDPTRLVVV